MLVQLSTCFALVALTLAAGGQQQNPNVMPGAPVSTDDLKYLDFALKNVKGYFQSSKNSLPESIKLIGATTQVVAGIRYEYHFLISSGNNQYDLCRSSLWVRPWLSEDYITQLDDPIQCGIPNSLLESLEQSINMQTNDLYWSMITSQPKITVEGANIKLEDVALTRTSCTKQDYSDGKQCDVADISDAKPKFRATAQLGWSGRGFYIADLQTENY